MTTGNTKLAARLREMAATLGRDIEERRRPRLENTRRRAQIAASIRQDARRMEKVQAALLGLADAHAQNRVPEVLADVTTKRQIEYLVHLYKPTPQEQAQKDALLALSHPNAGQLTVEDHIKEMERQLVGRKIDGFFPTPAALVRVMLRYADIQPGDKVLEPSAGKGNIADLVRAEHPDADLDVIECNHALRMILTFKGHNLIAVDCMDVKTPIYNVIVMNPPFEHLADIDHVLHAYNHLLADGGRLVSIMGEGPFFRQDKKAQAFRAWLAAQVDEGGTVIELPEGTFKESGTGVRTRMIVVNKPEGHQPMTAEQTVGLAAAQGILPEAQESDDPLEHFLDEAGDFIPLYPDDLEAEPQELSGLEVDTLAGAMAATLAAEFAQAITQASIEAQEGSTDDPSSLQERGLQKALDGFGAYDKLLRLRQTRFL